VTFQTRNTRVAQGLVEYDIVQCDNPSCSVEQTSTGLIGWVQLSELGMSVKTLSGRVQLPAEFCSTTCLSEYLTALRQ
jgi:hypothetical protein